MMDKINTAWLAGLLEGEGCFCWSTMQSAKIQLQMTDEDVVRRVARLVGVEAKPQRKYPSHYGKKLMWRVDIHPPASLEIMRAVYPLMGTRRQQRIEYVIAKKRARRAFVVTNGKLLFGHKKVKPVSDEKRKALEQYLAEHPKAGNRTIARDLPELGSYMAVSRLRKKLAGCRILTSP